MKTNCFHLIIIVFAIIFSSCSIKPVNNEKSIIVSVDTTLVNFISANGLRFYIVSDWGFNGFYNQTEVAELMDRTAEFASPKFIVSCGDNFQTNGVRSVHDPLWTVNFEEVYKHPVFNVDWFPVLGNHDYKGSTQAIIDYSKISRRWNMPSHYYTLIKRVNNTTTVRFIFIDTPALLSEYRNNPEEYPDVLREDPSVQLNWLKDVLSKNLANFTFVFGHHPLYSASPKHGDTNELISMLKPIFDRHHVDFYFCGHDHDFQHLKPTGSYTDYFVTGTSGKIRPASIDENSLFSISKPGFTVVSIDSTQAKIQFVGTPENVIYKFVKNEKSK
jgi:hypothetical protein